MRLKKSKKSSVSLSINAIVVIVIAFVVLGLALTLTRTIFKGTMSKIPQALQLTELESQPSAENALTIPDSVEIQKGKTIELSIGYYNVDVNDRIAKLGVYSCTDAAGTPTTKIPLMTSISQKVGSSDGKAYKVILTETGLDGGGVTYICNIIAYDSTVDISTIATLDDPLVFAVKQFFLKVTS